MATVTHPELETRVVAQRPWLSKELIVYAALAIFVALLYSFVVNHVWEDYFIGFRHCENLCSGKGFVYNPHERLHGFTSPLGTLLPALCLLLTGKTSWEAAFWLFRVISILAFAGGCVLLVKSFMAAKPFYPFAGLTVALLYVLEPKLVEYSTDGQESAFMLVFVAWGLYLLSAGFTDRWLAGGMCGAGLMWTRPDGCVYVFALALAGFLFTERSRPKYVAAVFKSAAVCTVLYLPWFLWAWSYYGSPIPQTVIAKSNLSADLWTQLSAWLGNNFEYFLPNASSAFRPINDTVPHEGAIWWQGQDWSQWFLITSARFLGLFCVVYWLLPVNDPLGRMASVCFTVTCLYFSAIQWVAAWYYPPLTLLGVTVLVRGTFTLTALAEKWFPDDEIYGRGRILALLVILVLCVRQVLLLVLVGGQMRVQQQVIEEGQRVPIGVWFRENMKPHDRLMLEPIGYIGYFSGAHIIDWPGLVSREVTNLRKVGDFAAHRFAREIQPEWLLLRPEDLNTFPKQPFFKNYALVRVFDVTDRLNQYKYLPGLAWLNFDAIFYAYQKLASANEPSPYKETTIPISPVYVHHTRWSGDTGAGAGENSYLVFQLPERQYVSAIRLTFSYQDTPSPATCVLSWGTGANQLGRLEHELVWPQDTSDGEKSALLKVNDTIDQFRFSPSDKPFQFKLSEIKLLTAAAP